MAYLEPGSPDWWLRELYKRIVARRPIAQKLANYYDGKHNLAFASEKFLETFGGVFRAFADNWTRIVVDACEERLNIEGFRIPAKQSVEKGAAVANEAAGREAWRMWQENELDAQSQIAHTEALLHGAAYVTVWPGDDPATPDVTVEHASNAIVVSDTKRRRRRIAALRLYIDELGIEHAELFLPDGVWMYRSPKPRVSGTDQNASWIVDADNGGFQENPFGVVPMVELCNRPRLYVARGIDPLFASSEIAQIIPLQDALNVMFANMLVASESHAMPQRWLTGYEAERDQKTNEVKPLPFDSKSKVWWLEDPEATFGSFAAGDLGNYVKAIELGVQHIASMTETPPHYLNGSADRLSGESVRAAESGLVAKTRRKFRWFGEGWEEVMRLCGTMTANEALATASRAETIWADPETRTEAEHVDATVKLLALGLPPEYLWERIGMSPTEIERAKAMQADKLLIEGQPAVQPVVSIRG